MVEQWYYQNAQYAAVKKLRFIKDQEAKELLSNLGMRRPLNKVPLLSDILVWVPAKSYKNGWNS